MGRFRSLRFEACNNSDSVSHFLSLAIALWLCLSRLSLSLSLCISSSSSPLVCSLFSSPLPFSPSSLPTHVVNPPPLPPSPLISHMASSEWCYPEFTGTLCMCGCVRQPVMQQKYGGHLKKHTLLRSHAHLPISLCISSVMLLKR